MFSTTASKKLLPSRIKLLGNVSEKLMETGASVTLLSHLTPACGPVLGRGCRPVSRRRYVQSGEKSPHSNGDPAPPQ